MNRDDDLSSAGLYLHVPFCSAICPYCDFAVTTSNADRCARYVSSIAREVAEHSPAEFDSVEFDTVYFGGGTPSILSPGQLSRLQDLLTARYRIRAGSRWFLEANPEDVNLENAAAWHDLGFGTVSLGVQSFVDEELRFLGRRHDHADAHRAVEVCREAGLDTVSIDLMFGLPQQTIDSWRVSIDAAIALSPDHISCYQLTLHEGTPFARQRERGRLHELPEDEQADLFVMTHQRLGEAGFEAYEVSNFARAERHRSQHNQKYWTHTPYLGLGPSSHSFNGRRRWWNARSIRDYEQALAESRSPIAGDETLNERDLALETVMLRLRTTAGLDLAWFDSTFGIDLWTLNQKRLEISVAAGLAVREGALLRLTREGLAMANGVVAHLELA